MALTDKEAKEVADALADLRGDDRIWLALERVIQSAVDDANDLATTPVISNDERNFWAGGERGLKELRQDLRDLRSGNYQLSSNRSINQDKKEPDTEEGED